MKRKYDNKAVLGKPPFKRLHRGTVNLPEDFLITGVT